MPVNGERRIHIGFSNIDMQFSVFWPTVGYGMQQEATRLGVDLTLKTARNPAEQVADIEYFLEQPVEAVLVAPIVPTDSRHQALLTVIDKVNAAGIPIVAINEEIGQGRQHCTVHSDQAKGQQLVTEYILQKLKGSGQIVHLQGVMETRIARHRSEGFHSVLDHYPDIELVFEAAGDWSQQTGVRLMRQALAAHPEIAAVIAANDEIALGAVEVIEEAGRAGEILIAGFDALPEALIAISEGKMAATVRQVADRMARQSLEMTLKTLRRESVPPLVLIEADLITIDNVLEGMMDGLNILPGMVRGLAESNRAQQQLQQQVIEAQQQSIQELSTPVIPVLDEMIVMPLIGSIDSMRARDITRSLLAGISAHRAKVVILDVTGVSTMNTGIVNHLNRTIQAARLKGAQTIVTGISDTAAELIVDLGIDWSGITTLSDLQSGLMVALDSLGFKLNQGSR
jgi:ABC-type sugar transport system substrate-binding protein/anti-anti-sigma regulatory factor